MIPCEGYYKDKKYDKFRNINNRVIFEVTVPEFFPNEPYKIRCKTSVFTLLFIVELVDIPSKY